MTIIQNTYYFTDTVAWDSGYDLDNLGISRILRLERSLLMPTGDPS